MYRLTLALTVVAMAMSSGCADRTDSLPDPVTDDAAVQPPVLRGPEADAEPAKLAGTTWELVKIQSMDDTAWVPADSSRYTLSFAADGDASMRLDCNQGKTSWRSDGVGQLAFGPVATTNALCQDDGLSERYAAQFEFVRSYQLRDGDLFLATYADGAIIELRPAN